MQPLDIENKSMHDLISILHQNKLSKNEELFYFVDMGYEFYILKGKDDNREILYEGNTIGFIQEMMQHFDVKDYDQ